MMIKSFDQKHNYNCFNNILHFAKYHNALLIFEEYPPQLSLTLKKDNEDLSFVDKEKWN